MALNVVPVAGQSLGSSRDLIAQNFAVIDTAFSVNHVPYNDGAGLQGIHNFVTFPSTHTLYSPLATTNIQVGLYSKNGSISGNPELFFQRASQPANSGYSITEATASSPGWTRLPSGILLKWGNSFFSGASSTLTVNINAIGPAFGTVLNIQISPAGTSYNGVLTVTSQTFANFTVTANPFIIGVPANTVGINYFVIGT